MMKINNQIIFVVLFIFAVGIILGVGSISASDIADGKYVKDSGFKILDQDLTGIIDGLSSDIVFSGAKVKVNAKAPLSGDPGKTPGGGLPRL